MATISKVGIGGHIKGFDVLVGGDTITVTAETLPGWMVRKTVENLGKFIAEAKDLKLGWAATEDDNIIYLYDKGDDNFGYALNVDCDWCSEWGYAPFGRAEKEED